MECWTQAAILANDLSDQTDDSIVGKRRWISSLTRGTSILIVTTVAGFGFLVLAFVAGMKSPLLAYLGALAMALLYSVKPFRFKERGLLGLFSYAFSTALGYAVLPWLWIGSNWLALTLLGPAVLLDKWVNLHFHQLVDYEADRSGGVQSYAVRAGYKGARRLLKQVSILTSAWLLATLVFVVFLMPTWRGIIAGGSIAAILAVAVHVGIKRQNPAKATVVICELPTAYLSLTYVLFRVVPAILFLRLAFLKPMMWVVFSIMALLLMIESLHALRYQYD